MKKWISICGGVAVVVLVAVLSLVKSLSGSEPSEPVTTPPASGNSPVQVVIYQCDPGRSDAWKALADTYSAQTGITVTVVTGDPENCDSDLFARLQQDGAPTIFCLHETTISAEFLPFCLDLQGSSVANALCSEAFSLKKDGHVYGVAANIESYGLIYNAQLLAQSGYTKETIQNFTNLQDAVALITANKKNYKFSAFPSPDLDDTSHGSLLCLLAGLSDKPDALRAFWDLYINNCVSSAKQFAANSADSAFEEFRQEKSVFFLGGTWNYEDFSDLEDYNLSIFPVYTSDDRENPGFYSSCTAYWCVNATVSEADQQAALDFLGWMVTAQGETPAPVDSLELLSPYRDANYFGNPLEKVVRASLRDENSGTIWYDCGSLPQEDLAEFGEALAAYSVTPTDEKWADVLELLSPGQ